MPGTSDFGTFGRYTELSLDEMTADQKRVYEFTVKQRGEVPGPYKIWLQNPKLIEVMVPLGAYYQGHSSLSKAEIEIATNLTNAKWLGASGRGPTKFCRCSSGDAELVEDALHCKVYGLVMCAPPPTTTILWRPSSSRGPSERVTTRPDQPPRRS
jgi:hypothetical protein